MKRAIVGFCWTVLGLLLSGTASGCMWDTDTLANEAKGLPDVVQVITGRFERNPPLFYEMRLKRVSAELDKEPGLLGDYDDAAVACERLSRDDEALAWMQKKRERLEKADRTRPEIKEHWYRYYANIGTFRAHRWLRAGAHKAHIAEMEAARAEIAKAIEINPDAHFGREKVQLAFMDWIMEPRDKKSTPARDITGLIPGTSDWERNRKGLCGLIVLGSAWESVDAFWMLTDRAFVDKQTVQYLAGLRCRELISQGHHSLYADDAQVLSDSDPKRLMLSGNIPGEIEGQFRQLRAEAEEWQKGRTDYMMARLKTGRHPDTDPTFWNVWKETPPPSLEVPWYRFLASRGWDPIYIASHIESYLLAIVAVGVGLKLIGIGRRQRKARMLEKSGTA